MIYLCVLCGLCVLCVKNLLLAFLRAPSGQYWRFTRAFYFSIGTRTTLPHSVHEPS